MRQVIRDIRAGVVGQSQRVREGSARFPLHELPGNDADGRFNRPVDFQHARALPV